MAITMGIGTILESGQLLMIASGEKKAEAVALALQGPVTAQITASAIQAYQSRADVIIDKQAALKIKKATLNAYI